MAFPHQEGEYQVEKSHVLDCNGQKQHMEIRVTPVDPKWAATMAARRAKYPEQHGPEQLPRYIAVYANDEAGRGPIDALLYYLEGEDALLEQDWTRITTDPAVSLKALQWERLILWHGTGYVRGGGIIMF